MWTQSACEEVIYQGYPVDAVLAKVVLLSLLLRIVPESTGVWQQLQPALTADGSISDAAKSLCLIRMAEADKKLLDGADELLQVGVWPLASAFMFWWKTEGPNSCWT